MEERLQGVMETSTPAEAVAMSGLSLLQGVTDQQATIQGVAPGILCMRILIVNVCFIADTANPHKWILVDTGLPDSAGSIIEACEENYGKGNPPQAIILTHGHFDHVGAVEQLLRYWQVPVYAHQAELPYLTGQKNYPPADPSVSDGFMAKISPLYPRTAINLGDNVLTLPADGSVPGAPEWRWIHTPGHTPGHVSLFRERDRTLVAGDAFTTVKQESAVAVLNQEKEVHGPPTYFTTDWQAAWESVRHLESLNPAFVATGHGLPLRGDQLSEQLKVLAEEFDRVAIPDQGRYVH